MRKVSLNFASSYSHWNSLDIYRQSGTTRWKYLYGRLVGTHKGFLLHYNEFEYRLHRYAQRDRIKEVL